MKIDVREAEAEDGPAFIAVIEAAFGREEGPELVELVSTLLKDETAHPLWSLVGVQGERVVGHILFTSTQLDPQTTGERSAIMAPLAVDPSCQKQGVGRELIARGLERLRADGVRLVFVLGDPKYYSRHGFVAAGALGYQPPYPLPEQYAGAWMVQELAGGSLEAFRGTVRCANALDHPKYW